ncbi:MAG: DinB family protein [Candidatus Rokuibacteriota bacterium]
MRPDERASLIERYANGPKRLREALATVPAEAMQWRPKAGEWSAHEVAVHCADSETQAASRIRVLAVEKEPVILGYDQETWARDFDYHAHPVDLALAAVDAVRANTAALLRRLPEGVWQREGRHTESGRYTAEDWLRIYAEHLDGHARQVEGNVAAWRQRAGGG